MKTNTRRLILSALFLALGYILPFFTGQIPQIGTMLSPMHLPVLLCGFICGPVWGAAVGLILPLWRSLTLGMPQLFPMAFCMTFELAVYGLVSGALYRRVQHTAGGIYAALIPAMLAGRVVWGVMRFICAGLDPSKFGFAAFIAGAVTNAVPGIILQLVLVPVIVPALVRTGLAAGA